MSKHLALLRSGRWFGALDDALQRALVDAARPLTLGDGALLFARGDPADGLYAVLDGALRIQGSSANGKEALLIRLEPPNWFGEIAVFDGLPRTHDARADGETALLHVPAAPLRALLDAEPRRWHALGLLVAAKLRLALTTLEEAALFPASVRLAKRLALMADAYGAASPRRVVRAKQDELAAMLALSRQTVNQLLKDLELAGVVRVRWGEIEIVDAEALARRGEG